MAKQVDVLVIGGGSIGVCCAYFLREAGREVTLVDQSEVGAACSAGNAGIIARSHIIPLPRPGVLRQGIKWLFDPEGPFYIKPRVNLALWFWLLRFGAACRKAPMLRSMRLLSNLIESSLALYEKFASMGGEEFHFGHRGSLALYKSSQSLEAGAREAEVLRPYGIESQALNQARVRALEPRIQPQIAGGICFNADAHLNPFEFVRWLASRSQSKGATFLTSTQVSGLKSNGNRISTVTTTRGDFEPDQVVLAAGSWSSKLAAQLRLALPIQPAKGYSITVKCRNRVDSLPLWLSESRVVVTPMGGVLRFAGTLELTGLDFSINQRRVHAIRRAVREYLAGVDEYETVETWSGLRPLTPDGLPIIDIPERWNNLVIATGHGMQGIALGPITGKVVAELLSNEATSVDVSALSARRFR
jgi:D-amino-acid dehydrogenase